MGNVLRAINETVVLQEVPGEISLAFTMTGCPLRCRGCHSSDLRNPTLGEPLTQVYLAQRLQQYRGLISCVVFLGGEWLPEQLKPLLQLVCAKGLNTCLYTGLEQAPASLLPYLRYVKTGPWIAARGGLDNPNTNQRFIDLRHGRDLTYRFQS